MFAGQSGYQTSEWAENFDSDSKDCNKLMMTLVMIAHQIIDIKIEEMMAAEKNIINILLASNVIVPTTPETKEN